MLYIIAIVIVSSMVPTTLKYARLKDFNTDYVIFFNYVIAVVFSCIGAIRSGTVEGFTAISEGNIKSLFSIVSIPNTYLLVTLVGVLSGILYYLALILVRMSVIENGMSKTSMFSRLSFLISLFAAVIFWREIPSLLSGLGILCGIISIMLLLDSSQNKDGKKWILVLILFVNGLVEVGNKIITMYSADKSYKDLFIAVVYISALLTCSSVLIGSKDHKNEKIRIQEIGLGVILGLPNVTISILTLKALEVIPSAITFASIASGSVLMSTVIGRYVFKELVGAKQKIAVIITVFGLVLMNIG